MHDAELQSSTIQLAHGILPKPSTGLHLLAVRTHISTIGYLDSNHQAETCSEDLSSHYKRPNYLV